MGTEEEKKAEEQKKLEDQEKWDKQRQEVDQANANFRKAQAEAEAAVAEKEAISEQLGQVTSEVGELKAAAKEKEAELESLDPLSVDPGVIKNLETLRSELSETRKQLSTLQQKAVQYEAQETARQQVETKKSREEAILGACDEKYGAKYRNAALKLAAEKVEKSGKAPGSNTRDPYIVTTQVYTFMDSCYAEVAKVKEEPKKEVPVDTGAGGVIFQDGDVKSGTLQDVLKQMRPKLKNMKLPSP